MYWNKRCITFCIVINNVLNIVINIQNTTILNLEPVILTGFYTSTKIIYIWYSYNYVDNFYSTEN